MSTIPVIQEKEFEFGGEVFIANTLRSLYHKASASLLIADCHFGKAMHFRRHNLPIPQQAAVQDYVLLNEILKYYKPSQCLFLGDLFHSSANREWEWLRETISEFNEILLTLVEGNHDILPEKQYSEAGIAMTQIVKLTEDIILSHEPIENEDVFNICGHIHPGFLLRGKARQAIGLPCFYQHRKTLIMPSFGRLTGHVKMNSMKPGKAFCFTTNEFYVVEND